MKHRPRSVPRQRDEGVALILALLFVVLLTVLVVEFGYETQVEASFATNQGSDFEAYLAAKSGVAKGIGMLQEDLLEDELNGESERDSMLDFWALPSAPEPLNEALMRTSIADEYGKINLNAIMQTTEGVPQPREEMVVALTEFFLLRAPDSDVGAEAIVDAIVDWVDYGDEDQEQPEGAENDYYTGLENPFPCKNGPMDSIEELLLIKGMTPEIYFGDPEQEQMPLSEYLTVHGHWKGKVNINTAPIDVLAAMIGGFSGAPADLGQAQELYDQARAQPFDQPPDKLPCVVKSNVFRIYGDGMLEDVLVRVEAYVFRRPNVWEPPEQDDVLPLDPPVEPFRILAWKVIR